MRSREDSPDLYELVRAIPSKFVHQAPQGKHGEYVPHHVITQMILATVGPFQWEVVEVLRGRVPEQGKHPALENAVVGAICRMTLAIDDTVVSIEEAGSCDAAGFEWNDAERLKKATSDAIKRCAMRLGIGIQLWCKSDDEWFVARALRGKDDPQAELGPVAVGGVNDDA